MIQKINKIPLLRESKNIAKDILEMFLKTSFGNKIFFKYIHKKYSSYSNKPNFIRIETTNFCNSKCTFCPHKSMKRKKGVIAENLFKAVIDQAADWRVKEVHLQNFGEPLMDKNLGKRIKYAKSKNIPKVVLFTNASLLSDKKSQEIIQSGLDTLFISFEGYSKEIYNSSRIGLDYDKVSSNIKNFYYLKRKLNTKNPQLILNVVYEKKYKKIAKKFKKEWIKYYDGIVFQQLHNWGKGNLKAKFNIKTFCTEPWNYMTINWNGDVVFCCLDYEGFVPVGNAKNEPLKKIWNNEKYSLLRKSILQGKLSNIGLCKNCSVPYISKHHYYNCLISKIN
ncbi:MAG: radical SAM/SPASM domain-containing protein [archaeon]